MKDRDLYARQFWEMEIQETTVNLPAIQSSSLPIVRKPDDGAVDDSCGRLVSLMGCCQPCIAD